jgi:hypothetical protein
MTERTKAEDPMAAVRVYIDAFNKGDAKAAAGWKQANQIERN